MLCGVECKASDMGIESWWPKLEPSTREWLIAHNGEELPAEIAAEIRRTGGDAAEESGGTGAFLRDGDVDWIEAAANDERTSTS